MELGLKMDKNCIDVKLQIANFMMWRDDFEQARKELLEVHSWIVQGKEEYENEAVSTAGKYLIEVEEFKKALGLFEKLHEDMSSELEVIYMLAFCSFKLSRLISCEEYLEEYELIKQDGEIVNEEIEEAVAEMKLELTKRRKEYEETGEEGDEEDEEWMDVEDNDDSMEG